MTTLLFSKYYQGDTNTLVAEPMIRRNGRLYPAPIKNCNFIGLLNTGRSCHSSVIIHKKNDHNKNLEATKISANTVLWCEDVEYIVNRTSNYIYAIYEKLPKT